jgi:hypothetical protein
MLGGNPADAWQIDGRRDRGLRRSGAALQAGERVGRLSPIFSERQAASSEITLVYTPWCVEAYSALVAKRPMTALRKKSSPRIPAQRADGREPCEVWRSNRRRKRTHRAGRTNSACSFERGHELRISVRSGLCSKKL